METEKLEIFSSPEQKEIPKPHIRLEFFRHDAKEKPTTSGPRPDDEKVRLTAEGRKHATGAGKQKRPQADMAIAYGSPRERSIETSLRHMLADEDSITDDMTLEEIKEEIRKHVKVGSKQKVTQNLNFNFDGSEEYHDAYYRHYLQDRDSLRFFVNESDNFVNRVMDAQSTSYSRAAGNIAELVKRYFKVLPNWEHITEKSKKKEEYQQKGNELQRFFGSHQGVPECFLLKIIEKNEGRQAALDFIENLEDKNGFEYSEGFSLVIKKAGDGIVGILKLGNKEWQVDEDVLDQLIQERDDLNEKFKPEWKNNQNVCPLILKIELKIRNVHRTTACMRLRLFTKAFAQICYANFSYTQTL